MESSLYQAEVREFSSISNDMQLLLRHKLPLGATPCSANGTGSSRGFQPQANSPHLGRGANLQKIYKVLDRTKALHGPRTQAYGETNYLKEKLRSFGQNQGLAWSSDSSLWGNQLLKRKYTKFWTEPRPCMVLGLKPMGKPTI